MKKLVPLFAFLLGCQGAMEVDFEDEVLVAPESVYVVHQQLEGTQRVFVNFDGPVVSDCDNYCSDAPGDRSWAIGAHFGRSRIDFAAYTDTNGRAEILAELRAAFAPYDVEFTTRRPSSGSYTMLVVSPTSGPNHGVAPLDCRNRNPNDIAFVYRTGDVSRGFVARAAVHELGHSFGLAHVTNGGDYMHWDASGDAFTRAAHDTDRSAAKCFDGGVQDAPQMLTAALGTGETGGTISTAPDNVHLRNALAGGAADVSYRYGNAGDTVLSCDWDGDGVDTVAVYRDGVFHLRNSNTGGVADVTFRYGRTTDTPLCGDWNGDGVDTVGVWRDGAFYLRNRNEGGNADLSFRYGASTDEPLVGDWDGDGVDTVAVRRGNVFHLRNEPGAGGSADVSFAYGHASDVAIVGDWDRDGTDTIGIVRAGAFHLRNRHAGGAADVSFRYGASTDAAIAGDWNGDGRSTIGIVRD